MSEFYVAAPFIDADHRCSIEERELVEKLGIRR
jgi:hypothetical protein